MEDSPIQIRLLIVHLKTTEIVWLGEMDTLSTLLVSSISWSQWCVWHVAYCCVFGCSVACRRIDKATLVKVPHDGETWHPVMADIYCAAHDQPTSVCLRSVFFAVRLHIFIKSWSVWLSDMSLNLLRSWRGFHAEFPIPRWATIFHHTLYSLQLCCEVSIIMYFRRRMRWFEEDHYGWTRLMALRDMVTFMNR